MKRRDFLKSSIETGVQLGLLSATSSGLAGCMSLDRLFSLERDTFDNEVIIIGAGAAGLSAAFELKKRKIPFRIFEASSRVGGRILTLRSGIEGYDPIELGAESFFKKDKIIFELAKELNLNIVETENDPRIESVLFNHNQRWLPLRTRAESFKKSLTQIYRLKYKYLPMSFAKVDRTELMNLAAWQTLDQLTASDLIQRERISLDPLAQSYLQSQSLVLNGLGLSDVSALAWFLSMDDEASLSHFRIEGGLGQLTLGLFERVSGVVADKQILFNYKLTQISESGRQFMLSFQTPQGQKVLKAENLIMALPFSQLKNISGLTSMSLVDDKKRAIAALQVIKLQKTVLKFNESFWREKSESMPANAGQWFGGHSFAKSWDSSWNFNSNASSSEKGNSKEFQLSFISHFDDSRAQSPSSQVEQIVSELVKNYPKISTKMRDQILKESEFYNWSNDHLIQGDFPMFRRSQFSQFDTSIWQSPDYMGHWQWAGDYTAMSAMRSSVANALMSGQIAAERISKVFKPNHI